ncbi:MAG: hypothetical protein P1U68_06740 [Verrucomicrobiales bacterium]|nr:hypothetical protein [Verrucomicrobiales bacterium]
MSITPSFIVSALFIASTVVSLGEVTEKTREFRPLEAKKVVIRPAAQVAEGLHHEVKAEAFLAQAWSQFDAKDWSGAMSSFVSALEADPECREAAEGLAMGIYHTGDYASAYRLGEELKVVMPNVRRIVAETALTDVRGLIAEGQFADARSFLSHFPATGPTLAYAHHLVQTADNLTASIDKANGIEQSPAEERESLVRN